jgi:hypothetical protein
MEIYGQAESLLRQGGYRTRVVPGTPIDVLSFEDEAVIGFLRVFGTAAELVAGWQTAERSDLARHASQLKTAPKKAWNIYSIFLTEGPASSANLRDIEAVEEDFSATRKIARASVTSAADLERALLPLLPLRAITTLVTLSDHQAKLRSHLSFLPPHVCEAILEGASPGEILRRASDTP